MRKITCIIIMIMTLALTNACKTTQNQPPKPEATYQPTEPTLPTSSVNIPINIDLKTLEAAVNANIQGVIYEDNSYTNNNNDQLKTTATKSQNITLKFDDKNNIYYRVPIKLWVSKNILVSDLIAEGEIALNFKTYYTLKPDWSIQTFTNVENFGWIKKPALKTGIGDLPIEYIANLVLNKTKNDLAKTIDEQVKNNFELRKYVQNAWNLLQEPALIDPTYKMWLQIQPKNLTITPLRSTPTAITANVMAQGTSVVTFGEKPYFKTNTNLPPYTLAAPPKQNNYQIWVAAEVPYPEAEQLANKNLVNQTFTSGKKTATIKKIQIYGRFDKLVINTTLAGTYNGSIYLTGKPTYNAQTNTIEILDLDFDLETKNFMAKSINWLAHKNILQAIQAQMKFPLEKNLQQAQKMLQAELRNFELTKGVYLQAQINTLKIEQTYLTPQAIKVIMNSTGNLNMRVQGLY